MNMIYCTNPLINQWALVSINNNNFEINFSQILVLTLVSNSRCTTIKTYGCIVKILLADDHGLFRDSMSVWLKQLEENLDIHFSSTYKEVSDQLNNNSYDLVLLDLGMPEMQDIISIKNFATLLITHPSLLSLLMKTPLQSQPVSMLARLVMSQNHLAVKQFQMPSSKYSQVQNIFLPTQPHIIYPN